VSSSRVLPASAVSSWSLSYKPVRQLLVLTVVMAAIGYIRTAISPLQEAMRIGLVLTDNEMALLQGPVIGIPVALLAIPLGVLIDRHSRTRLLITLVVLSLTGSLFTGMVTDFRWLLIARGIAGVAGLGIIPVVLSLLADLFPPAQRGRATTVIFVGQVAGNSAAFAWGGAVLAAAGSAPSAWQDAMLLLNVPLVPILLVVIGLREPARTNACAEIPSFNSAWMIMRPRRVAIVSLTAGIVLLEIAVGALLIWAAPMLSRNFGLAPDNVGAVMAIGMLVSGVIGPIFGGTLADICQRSGGPQLTATRLAALAVLCVPLGHFGFTESVISASILLVGAMTMLLAGAIMGMALFSIVVPSEIRGICMSVLVAACILFGLAFSPVTVSILSGEMGGPAMIGRALAIVCMFTCVLASMAFAYGRAHLVGVLPQ
jgi:MFS family permease